MPDSSSLLRRTFLGIGGAAAAVHASRAFAFAPQSAAASAAGSAATGIKVEKNVVVGKAGDTDLHCDIYRPPAGTEKRMALIHFHGGGFVGGNKELLANRVTQITGRGYVSVTAQYRLAGVAKWPSQIDDAVTHIRWVRSHADSLGIDPNRIALVGYSAGGHIALFAAGQPDLGLAACVAFYPATNLEKAAAQLMPPGSDAEALKNASPLSRIREGYPPTVLFHGLADTTVEPANSQRLLQTLRADKVPSELHTFDGAIHAFDVDPTFAEACAGLTDFFLDRQVLHPRTHPSGMPIAADLRKQTLA